MTLKWLIHIHNHCCGFERLIGYCSKCFQFVLMLGLHLRPGRLVEHTVQALRRIFLNSDEFNSTIYASIILQNAPKLIAAGAPPQIPLELSELSGKLIVFIPSNATHSSKMRQTLWRLELHPRTHPSSYIHRTI